MCRVKRDLNRLANETFDLLVVGAGIYGATIALDAAQRGLSVAIIDRGDFGAATSFNSLKTIHGGVRSLLYGNIREMREFVGERRALMRIAPHLVHPLAFLIPTFRSLVRNRLTLGIFLTAYDLGAWDRNDIQDSSKHLPRSRVLRLEEFRQLYPLKDGSHVTGGAMWHDCQMYSSERVTLAFVQSACERDAAAANHVEAIAFLRRGNRVEGVRAKDVLSGDEFDIRARLTINAAGPWVDGLLDLVQHRRGAPQAGMSKTMNLVIRRVTEAHALGGVAGSRFLIIVPWRDRSIAGTSHEAYYGEPDELRVTLANIEKFLAEINIAFPFAKLTPSDVRLVHCGLLPMKSAKGCEVKLLKKSRIRDHASEGIPGLMSVLGVRFSTARLTAQRAVDAAAAILGRETPPCRSAMTPLTGGDIPNFAEYIDSILSRQQPELSATTLRRLVVCYGTAHEAVISLMRQDPALAQPLGSACDVTRAEIEYAVTQEGAIKLGDAILRRTEAGTGGHPGADALREAAELMAARLGWDDARVRREIAEVEKVYEVPV